VVAPLASLLAENFPQQLAAACFVRRLKAA
jgi:hypothetical protein